MEPYKILLLEDDQELLEVLGDVLCDEGFSVDRCQSSDEAIARARESEYDLMVADIRMAGLDGLSALSQVQSYRPSVDGLVITGYADSEQARRASQLGLGAVLKKPFELDEFLHKVNTLLRERTQRLRTAETFEQVLSSLRWSTRQLARTLGAASEPRFDLELLTNLVGYLCSQAGLSGATLERVRSASLAAAWRESGPTTRPLPPAQLPEEFHEWLAALPEWWDGSGPQGWQSERIPLPARVIVLALAFAHNGSRTETPGAKWPGRFDPALLDALERMPEQLEQGGAESTSRSARNANLLALAQTLLQGGDYDNAWQALSEIIERGGADSEDGVKALVLSARIKQSSGHPEEAKNIARRLPEVGRAFGPVLHAYSLSEAGKLLGELNEPQQAVLNLDKACQLYRQLGLEAYAAEAFLRSRHIGGKLFDSQGDLAPLEILLRPAHRDLARPLASLVYQAIASRKELPAWGERVMARLARSFPVALGMPLSDSSPSPAEETPVPDLSVRLLGGLEVLAGDHPVPPRAWRTSKTKFLFARLLAAPQGVPEEVLVEEFWPGNLAKGRDSLYTASSHIRSTIRKAGLQALAVVEKTPTGLRLDPNMSVSSDVLNMREQLAAGKRAVAAGDWPSALSAYQQAVVLGEGAYLPDCYMDWAVALREDLERELVDACLRMARYALRHEAPQQTVEFARRALRYDPYDEIATALLLEGLTQVGRPMEANRVYSKFVETITEEFGEPPADLEELRALAVASATKDEVEA